MATEQSFDEAFNEFAGSEDEPVQDEPAEQAAEANQDAEPIAEAPAEDPGPDAPAAAEEPADKPPTWDELLAALPADKAERYKPLVEHTSREMHRLRSDAGRVPAMQRLLHEERLRAETEAKRAEEAERQRKELEARASQPMTKAEQAELDEAKDKFAEEFPEFSEAVNIRINNLLKKHLGTAQSAPPVAPAAQVPQHPSAPQQEAAQQPGARQEILAREYAALFAAHPDWQQANASEAFAQWKAAQGAEVRRLIESDYADDAIRVLDRFKADLAIARQRQELTRQAENRKRLEQNVSIKGTPSRPAAIPDDFESAFNFHVKQDELRAQRQR